jgi:RNA polymerase sigma-70 factor, ECF subfamily
MDDTRTDADLIYEAKTGKLASFGELVHRYQDGIRTFLLIRLANRHEAEDLAQEAFVIAYRRLKEFDASHAFGPWLRGIAHNLWRNHLRKHRPLPSGSAEDLASIADARWFERYDASQESALLMALEICLEKLPVPDRTLLHLRYHEESTVAALAKSAGRKESAITMHLFRLRQALAQCIQQQLPNMS